MQLIAGPARFVGDLPLSLGGFDLGPTPHDLVATALAACTVQTLRLYARRKGWALRRVNVDVAHGADPAAAPPETYTRTITIGGDLHAAQRARLIEIAGKCPIHRLLSPGATVVTLVADSEGDFSSRSA